MHDRFNYFSCVLSLDTIKHHTFLRRHYCPTIRYLFYLAQIGLSLSPLSNNLLFLDISKNPFMQFFETGMNVVLTTDDPLQFHMSREPLIEEYVKLALHLHAMVVGRFRFTLCTKERELFIFYSFLSF